MTVDRQPGVDVVADLATAEGRADAIAAVSAHTGGRIDGLATCAGVGGAPPAVIAAINYLGTVELLDGLFPALQQGDRPAAVMISSSTISYVDVAHHHELCARLEAGEDPVDAITRGTDPLGSYINSKIAIAWACRARSAAWGAKGVRLNAVVPGMTDTPLLAKAGPTPDTTAARREVAPVPLGRIAQPTELAAVIAFLLSDDASYVHGSVIYVDGGQAAAIDQRRM